MLREITELVDAQYDVCIYGGRDQNSMMNGHYYRLSGCFGQIVFRMTKKVETEIVGLTKRVETEVIDRYIFRYAKKLWVISSRRGLLKGIESKPGCAFADDEEANHPAGVKNQWIVFDPARNEMNLQSREDGACDADGIRAVAVIGFLITGLHMISHLEINDDCLVQRHQNELNNRPVYEDQTGDLVLYFAASECFNSDDFTPDTEATSRPLPELLLAQEGHWVLATRLGVGIDSCDCVAYIKDSAITPDLINPSEQWSVLVPSSAGTPTIVASQELRLILQEWG